MATRMRCKTPSPTSARRNAVIAFPEFYSLPRLFWMQIPIRPETTFVKPFREIFAAAPATRRLCKPSSWPRKKMSREEEKLLGDRQAAPQDRCEGQMRRRDGLCG